jgi:hypothetical protein
MFVLGLERITFDHSALEKHTGTQARRDLSGPRLSCFVGVVMLMLMLILMLS